MSTWDQICAGVRDRLRLAEDGPHGLRVVIGRHPIVLAPALEEDGQPTYLIAGVSIGLLSEIFAGEALADALGVTLGALVLSGDRLVLRHAVALAGLDPDALIAALRRLAAEASYLRRRLTAARAAAPVVFAAYLD